MKTKEGDFAQGLKDFFTRGTLVTPVRLTNGMRNMIIDLMEESLSNTSTRFPEPEDDKHYEEFMQSMDFLKRIIQKNANRNVKMPKEVARTLYYWFTSEMKYHHLSDEPDFEKARAWVVSHVSRQFAISELAI